MEKLILLALCILITGCDGCKDPDDCPDRFHVPGEVIPYKKEYHIGDTITIISKFSKIVHELRTNRSYDMKNIDWYPNAFIQFLDTTGYNNSKISNHFKLLLEFNCEEYFVSFNDHSVIDCKYIFSNDSFLLQYKIIPKRPGNYFLSQKCAIGPTFNDQDFPGRCHGVGYDVIVDMNAGKDGNIDILKESKDSLYNTWVLLDPKGRFYDRGGFCFKVVP